MSFKIKKMSYCWALILQMKGCTTGSSSWLPLLAYPKERKMKATTTKGVNIS
jgi:hypothetical protein